MAKHPPERSRKFKSFREKSGDFYEILKKVNVNDNSSFNKNIFMIFRRIHRKFSQNP